MSVVTDQEKIDQLLSRGVENVYPSREFLEARLKEGKVLTLYVGVDPTADTLHVGHAIWLRKLRDFQAMGHQIILLIGDFTAMIGDPTDKAATRKRLTREEVLANAAHYQEQASKIIRFDGENPAKIRFNSEWLAKMLFGDVVELAAHFTVQQMMERDMFARRIEEQKPIYLHEFFYPLMQGYDCVAMDVDGEMGGNDQTFNMLAGRTLMKEMKGKEKFVVATKLLVDSSGKKMGKSEGNMIRFDDSSDDIFGKVMSWGDGMIVGGFELLTDVSQEEIVHISKSLIREEANPRDLKAQLAREVVAGFYGREEANAASARFDQLFREKEIPENIPIIKTELASLTIIEALVFTQLATSKGEARRLIDGGGVKLNEEVVTDYETMVTPTADGVLLQKGKRFFARLAH
jgi:tyrosyl-tRNA synthetase